MKPLTSKERMLIALGHGRPDRVPASPDISNMIPCRLTGKAFWQIYYDQDPPLWKAHADATRQLGLDGWMTNANVNYIYADAKWSFSNDVISRSTERLVVRTTCHTPAGDLWQETTYYPADAPTVTRKWIKNLKQDMPILRYMLPAIGGYDRTPLDEQSAYVGDDGVVSGNVPVPGLHDLVWWFDGGVEAAVYAEMDYPEEFEELLAMQAGHYLRMAEMLIDAKPDYFMIGASGLWTLSTPEHFKKYSLPVLKQMTRMSRQAGLISFLHSCGRQRAMIDLLAGETDLDVVNPMEIPPMGDCDLAEIKSIYRQRFALVGNIHTTEVMLFGSPEEVRTACRQAIDAAAEGGGFVLSTGDQCGRDTPLENIAAMVETAKEYGRYP